VVSIWLERRERRFCKYDYHSNKCDNKTVMRYKKRERGEGAIPGVSFFLAISLPP
jgi:hypothetical protein